MALLGAASVTCLFQSPNVIVPDWFAFPPTSATGYGLPVAAT